jgi:hypothetical protein
MAQAWYQYPRIDNFGTQDPQGAYWKPDSNVQVPGLFPITALDPGFVTSLLHTDFGQAVITIRLDKPYNSLAKYEFYEHLSRWNPSIKVGEHVDAGQLIGYNNPTGQVPLGFGFYSGPVYGSGPAWQELQNDLCKGCANKLNPVARLNAAAGGGETNNPNTFAANASNAVTKVTTFLQPGDTVGVVLGALDDLMVVNNPFAIPNPAKVSIFGFDSIVDPILYTEDVANNIATDMVAIIWRIMFLMLGIFILYKVIGNFINFGAIVNSASGAVRTAVQGAAILA